MNNNSNGKMETYLLNPIEITVYWTLCFSGVFMKCGVHDYETGGCWWNSVFETIHHVVYFDNILNEICWKLKFSIDFQQSVSF